MSIEQRLAERVKKVNPSSTLAITAKAKKLKSEGKDIINFAAGEPDFDTPEFIKLAAIEAIKNGFTKYTPSAGTSELRTLISEKFKKDNRLNFTAQQIIVSCGAKHSIFNALLTLVNRGDEVIIPAPYWVSYPEMVHMAEGLVRFLPTLAENNFKILPKVLEGCIGSKTKVLIINSPSNPTGCVYSKEELEAIASICVERNIFVISDEIYEKIIFDGLTHHSIASVRKDIYDLTITVNGLSKSHSMTGWRIGFLGAPLVIAEAISKLQDHSTSNPSSISQMAAVAALGSNDDFSKELCREFQARRDYVVIRLKEMELLKFIQPQGAFYIFCDISKTGMDSSVFSSRLLEEEFVSLIPGTGFGMPSWVRMSFATSREQLEKGMDRLGSWLNKV